VSANDTVTSHLTTDEIDDCFDYTYHLKNVDQIFNRIGLVDKK